MLDCDEGLSNVNIKNDYGLTDQAISKKSYQIAIGDAKIEASFTVTLDVTISTNLGDVIEVTADLFGEISGVLTLSLGTGELLPYTDWLIGLVSIFNANSTGYIADFFKAGAVFNASFNALVEPSFPFNLLGSADATGGFKTPFEINFLQPDETGYPDIDFEVEIDGIGDVRNLTFKQVIAILGEALEWLIGSSEDDSIESCSGGLLGKEIDGVNVFTYQLPGTSALGYRQACCCF